MPTDLHPYKPVGRPMRRRVIYLAGPYTSADAVGRQARFDALTKAASELIAQGHIVYSPITHTHPIDVHFQRAGVDLPSDYWCEFDETFMAVCTEMAILPLDGWEQSSGVKRERVYFEARGLPVWFIASRIEAATAGETACGLDPTDESLTRAAGDAQDQGHD